MELNQKLFSDIFFIELCFIIWINYEFGVRGIYIVWYLLHFVGFVLFFVVQYQLFTCVPVAIEIVPHRIISV
jgi:hypothetical protein